MKIHKLGSQLFIGIDDGYFPLHFKSMKGSTALVGVISNSNMEVIKILVDKVTVDGLDASSKAIELISRACSEVEGSELVVFLDGVTYAGFNIVDPTKLYTITGFPVITLFWRPLDLKRILRALSEHFNDWRYRYSVIASVYSMSKPITTPRGVLRASCYGISIDKAKRVIRLLQLYHPYPYPLRLADIVASAISRYWIKAVMKTIDDER